MAETVAPTVAVGRLVREALAELTDGRPFFGSEHAPIHPFKEHGHTLPETFADKYFAAATRPAWRRAAVFACGDARQLVAWLLSAHDGWTRSGRDSTGGSTSDAWPASNDFLPHAR